MVTNSNYKFFDKEGNGLDFSTSTLSFPSLGNIQASEYTTFTGSIFIPKVSVGLIESQQIFMLQDVIKNVTQHKLKPLLGKVSMTSGDTRLRGVSSYFTYEISAGNKIQIGNSIFTVISVIDDNTVVLDRSETFSDKSIYLIDYWFFSTPIVDEDDVDTIKAEIVNNDETYFLYNIDYSDRNTPWIRKSTSIDYALSQVTKSTLAGYSKPVISSAESIPLSINLGFSATTEDVFKNTLKISKVKTNVYALESLPSSNTDYIAFAFLGNDVYNFIKSYSQVNLQDSFGLYALDLLDCQFTSGYSVILVKNNTNALKAVSSYLQFSISITNQQTLATISLYAESESEDERFADLLSNFGRKVDMEDELIFSNSDINEMLPDFKLINKKRKELLLEGDNIFPYIGSYKALINAINFYGYSNLTIKEYFLNVDTTDKYFGKYLQVQVPKSQAERKQLNPLWDHLPSSSLKKTNKFGLFYNINKEIGEYDDNGVPIVEDTFEFTPEEVLIKLYGLKNVLQEQFLPLNSKIVDITGEGIYFIPVSINIWNDQLQTFTYELSRDLNVKIWPEKSAYLSDVRVIDEFYKNIFEKRGYKGFLNHQNLGNFDANVPVSSFKNTSANEFLGGKIASYDDYNENFFSFPPSISDYKFHENLKSLRKLENTKESLTGAPVLIEVLFDLVWDDLDITWNDMEILDMNNNIVNNSLWTWNNIERGNFIDAKFVVKYKDGRYFNHDSGRKSLDDFTFEYTDESGVKNRVLEPVLLPFDGNYEITVTLYDLNNNATSKTYPYIVNKRKFDIVSVYKNPGKTIDWENNEITWNDEITWTNNTCSKSTIDEFDVIWDDLSVANINNNLIINNVTRPLLAINRTLEKLTFALTSEFDSSRYLIAKREDSECLISDLEVDTANISYIGNNVYRITIDGSNFPIYSRVLITELIEFEDFSNNSSSFYYYVDVVDKASTYLDFFLNNDFLTEFNNILINNTKIFLTVGVFSGIHSFEIDKVVNNTVTEVYLKAGIHNINSIDGCFNYFTSEYDYVNALIKSDWELSKEVSNINVPVDEFPYRSDEFFSHGSLINGFLISDVTPNGMIQINEKEEFYFPSDNDLDIQDTNISVALDYIKQSDNEGLSLWDWDVIPSVEKTLTYNGNSIGGNFNFGAGIAYLDNAPDNLYVRAKISPQITIVGNEKTISSIIINCAGYGYTTIPNIKVSNPYKTDINWIKPEFSVSIINSSLNITLTTQGVCYDENTTIEIDYPLGAEEFDNFIYVGRNWLEVTGVVGTNEVLFFPVSVISSGFHYYDKIRVPYKWHSQQFLENKDLFNNFYFALHAKAKTQAQDSICYVTFDKGVKGEWKHNKYQTFSVSCVNDLTLYSKEENYFISDQFSRLKDNNFKFPFNDTDAIYYSSILSKQSSQDAASLMSDYFTVDNTIVTNEPIKNIKGLAVLFSASNSYIPSINKVSWKLHQNNICLLISHSKTLFWQFNESGIYDLECEIIDINGNVYRTLKNGVIEI